MVALPPRRARDAPPKPHRPPIRAQHRTRAVTLVPVFSRRSPFPAWGAGGHPGRCRWCRPQAPPGRPDPPAGMPAASWSGWGRAVRAGAPGPWNNCSDTGCFIVESALIVLVVDTVIHNCEPPIVGRGGMWYDVVSCSAAAVVFLPMVYSIRGNLKRSFKKRRKNLNIL